MYDSVVLGYFLRSLVGRSALQRALEQHFGGADLSQIVTAARDFPVTSRVDVNRALANMSWPGARLIGVHSAMNHETPTLAHLFTPGPFAVDLGPLQHDEVDIGDPDPIRCLKNGLWLARKGDLPFAVFLGPSMQFGQVGGVHVEVAVPTGEGGAAYHRRRRSHRPRSRTAAAPRTGGAAQQTAERNGWTP